MIEIPPDVLRVWMQRSIRGYRKRYDEALPQPLCVWLQS